MPNSALDVAEELQYLPGWARAAGLSHCFAHAGVSMLPTLRPGQFVYVRPILDNLKSGDVIVFVRPLENCRVTHRVVAITDVGVITRGDNNLEQDALPTQWDQIIGKVEIMEGGGRKQIVVGGSKGLRKARFRWAILKLSYWLRRLFWRPYRWLRLNRIVPKLWRPEINEIHLQADRGPLVKYIYKQHTVAVWDSSLQKFDCRKPFDLVIPSPLQETKSSS